MTDLEQLDDQLRALRVDFDHSFAKAATAGQAAYLDFLVIRVAGDPYALRLSEVASLQADRRLVAAPSLLPELLGIAGFRAVLTPIYDLGALLGYRAGSSSHWLVIAQWPAPIGFAFETFEAHLRVAPSEVSPATPAATGTAYGAVRSAAAPLPLLHLPSLIEGIARRIKASGPSQER